MRHLFAILLAIAIPMAGCSLPRIAGRDSVGVGLAERTALEMPGDIERAACIEELIAGRVLSEDEAVQPGPLEQPGFPRPARRPGPITGRRDHGRATDEPGAVERFPGRPEAVRDGAERAVGSDLAPAAPRERRRVDEPPRGPATGAGWIEPGPRRAGGPVRRSDDFPAAMRFRSTWGVSAAKSGTRLPVSSTSPPRSLGSWARRPAGSGEMICSLSGQMTMVGPTSSPPKLARRRA